MLNGANRYDVHRRAQSPLDRVLPRLDKARRTGPASWSARCPAHDDRSPSLSLKETDDGRILLHCFGGCEVASIVAALGLDLVDLFPERASAEHRTPKVRRPWSASDLLRLAAFETGIVTIAAADLAAGRALSEADRDRLIEAARRLGEIAEAAK